MLKWSWMSWGQSILADVEDAENHVILRRPMSLGMAMTAMGPRQVMGSWPEGTDQQEFPIPKQHVVLQYPPDKEVEGEYIKATSGLVVAQEMPAPGSGGMPGAGGGMLTGIFGG